MESCSVSLLLRNGLATLGLILLCISLLLFVAACLTLYFATSKATSTYPSTTAPVRDGGKSDEDDLTEEDMVTAAMIYSASLLDGGIEDIPIPPLCPVKKTRAADENNENTPMLGGGSEVLIDTTLDTLKIPVLEPKRKSHVVPSQHAPKERAPKCETQIQTTDSGSNGTSTSVVPWNGRINWALKGASVFDSPEQEYAAFRHRSNMINRQPYSDLWLFQYGIRYIPTNDERNSYRTVRIEQLPGDVTLSQLLPAITGEIYAARLTDTTAITGSNTAMITFVSQADAVKFLDQVAKKTLTLPAGRVVPVHTATYPMPADIERLIAEEGHTRCFGMYGFRYKLKENIARALAHLPHMDTSQIESIEDGAASDEVVLRFLSVKAAAAAFHFLRGHPALGKCQFRFLKQDGTPKVGGL